MHLGYWSDAEIGSNEDDYFGCDTLLNMGYYYNSDELDEDYYESNCPAIGYVFLKSPKINNEQLGLTSSLIFIPRSHPPAGGQARASVELYNNLTGFHWNGEPFIDPNTQQESKYVAPGDPVNKIGWYEGEGWPGGLPPG